MYHPASGPSRPDPSSNARSHPESGMESSPLAPELHDVHLIRNSELGSGSVGTVVRAWWQGALVAVKSVRAAFSLVESNDRLVDAMVSKLRKEAKFLCALRHPNIVQFFGLTRNDRLVMELMDMSLAARLHGDKKSPPLTTRQQVEIMFGASAGVQYLHSMDIVHRDLSSNNILLLELSAKRLVAKVTDYGTAVHINPDRVLTHQTCTHGSLPYLAPEVLQSSSRRGERTLVETVKSDVWSIGILALEVALAMPPQVLRPETRIQDVSQLREQRHVFVQFVPDCLNEEKPQSRPEAQEVNMVLRRLLAEINRSEDALGQRLHAAPDGQRLHAAPDGPPISSTVSASDIVIDALQPVPCTDDDEGHKDDVHSMSDWFMDSDFQGRTPDGVPTVSRQPRPVSFESLIRPPEPKVRPPLQSPNRTLGRSFSRSSSGSQHSAMTPPGPCAISEDVFQDIAEDFTDFWQCERLAVILQLQTGSSFVRQLQAQKMPTSEVAFCILRQWAVEKRSYATGEMLYNALCGRLQLRSVAERVQDKLLAADMIVDEVDGSPSSDQQRALPWQPKSLDVSIILKEDLLQRIADDIHIMVKCRRLAIYLGVGAGFVDRLNSMGNNNPVAVAFRVLQKFTEINGAGHESAVLLHNVLDDPNKVGLRRTASKYQHMLLV